MNRRSCTGMVLVFTVLLLLPAAKAKAGGQKMAHLYDVPGQRLESEFGYRLQDPEHTTAQVWVSSRPTGPRAERQLRKAVNASIRLDAQLSRRSPAPRYDVYVAPSIAGSCIITTVSDPIGYAATGRVRVFVGRTDDTIDGPVVELFTGWGSDGVFVPHRGSRVLSLAVTYRDRFGGWNVEIAFPSSDSPQEPIRLRLSDIAEVTNEATTSAIMLVTDRQKGTGVLRIIEVTDHIEDLVPPVRVSVSGDPRREPNLTKKQLRANRDAGSAMRLKFQQIVLSRGGQPPHTSVPGFSPLPERLSARW
jgi:hypothetical protein